MGHFIVANKEIPCEGDGSNVLIIKPHESVEESNPEKKKKGSWHQNAGREMAHVLLGSAPTSTFYHHHASHRSTGNPSTLVLPHARAPPPRRRACARALSDFTSIVEQSPAITWQVAVGTIAGVTPFLVAGVEFSKRIMAQKKCKVCGGSGLVKRDEYYFRCYSCGGFLPWQSWRRFFSGK